MHLSILPEGAQLANVSNSSFFFENSFCQVKYFDLAPLTDYGDNFLDEAAFLPRDHDAGVCDEICNVPTMGFSHQRLIDT